MKSFYYGLIRLAVLLPIVSWTFSAASYDFCCDGIFYKTDSSGMTFFVGGLKDDDITSGKQNVAFVTYESKDKETNMIHSNYVNDIVIPDKVIYNDTTYFVCGIDEKAFWGCDSLTSITIGAGLKYIDPTAFSGNFRLEVINVDNSNPNYTTVDSVLYTKDMSQLIYYPGGKKTLTFAIPESVRILPELVFIDCRNLKTIILGDGVQPFGFGLFACCENLTDIIVSSGNRHYTSIDGVLYSKDKKTLICYPSGKKSALFVVPDEVTRIEDSAFAECRGLEAVELSSNVTDIACMAFLGCENMKSITLSDSLTHIDDYVFFFCDKLSTVTIPRGLKCIDLSSFSCCTSLSNINVAADNQAFTLFDGVLYSKDMSTLLLYPQGRNSPTYVMPCSVDSIAYMAFDHCPYLTSIVYSDKLTKIPSHNITFGNLKTVTFGSNMIDLGSAEFFNCDSLQTIYCKSTIPPSSIWEAKTGCIYTTLLYVPRGTKEAYKAHTYWRGYARIEEMDFPDKEE